MFDGYGEARAGDIASLADTPVSSKCDPLTYHATHDRNGKVTNVLVTNDDGVNMLRLKNAQLYDTIEILLLGLEEMFIAGMTEYIDKFLYHI